MAWTGQQPVSDIFKSQSFVSDVWVTLIVSFNSFQDNAFQTNAFQVGEVFSEVDLFVKQGGAS